MPVNFTNISFDSNLKNKKVLSTFITNQIKKETLKSSSINYLFVSDEELLEMNNKFLNHNTYTDIITFDLSINNKKIIGEIYISVERVIENAKKFSVDYITELHRVIFHGALHLCGYKDKNKNDKVVMTSMEDKWLQTFEEIQKN